MVGRLSLKQAVRVQNLLPELTMTKDQAPMTNENDVNQFIDHRSFEHWSFP